MDRPSHDSRNLQQTAAKDVLELLTADEVGALLRTHPDRVYRLIRDRQLPAVHLGRSVRVFKHVLLAWLQSGGTVSSDRIVPPPSGALQT